MSKKPQHNSEPQEASVSATSARDASIASVRQARLAQLSSEELVTRLKTGDKTALSRAITLIESGAPKHQEQAKALLKLAFSTDNADDQSETLRIGITGVPGVGKSTFIEQLGMMLTEKGHRVAVLAVDPSSSVSGGSILGDKTRMQQLTQSPNAFIRPTPSKLTLGGVARHTRESIILCEAAGYDVILIETVGVGQSETAVHDLCDFFLLLQLAGAGDELQGIKRGIIEMADAIVINKADDETQLIKARAAQLEYQRALGLFPHKSSGWQPKTQTCSALNNRGIDKVWDMIQEFVALTQDNGHFAQKRIDQNLNWLEKTVTESLKEALLSHPDVLAQWNGLKEQVTHNLVSPVEAADQLLQSILKTKS
ncbi:MAG TPA: methylmalonyl Co-A mutase-associated GTPase MeaB [Flavobacteriaceae bacterium]|nr:methylmalonyl Co-A mutase-associated GTPase MeaB [Flavobacteriaceae bacterium]